MTKILFADDLETNRYLLRTLLAASGYEVLEASNGVEALDLARRERPDLILSDILMPQMDGFPLCRECQRDETLRSIPFVFYTATYTDPRDEELALGLGAARFITKPIENEEFLATLREVLENHERGQLPAGRSTLEEETVFYRLYNEALVRKLEDKMIALEESNRALASSEDQLRRLASGVAHELRNPLGVIHNIAYHLQQIVSLSPQTPLPIDHIQEYLKMLERETQLAVNIIYNLLYHTSPLETKVESVLLASLLHRILERLPAPEHVRVTLSLPDHLPPIRVNPQQVEQALSNLFLNAYEAMPAGGEVSVISKELLVTDDRTQMTEPWLLITVCDTGPGIPPENLPKLFEPLFTTKPHGIGLGLAVTRKLIEANGGRIQVESTPGRGTTFNIMLPIATEK
ncbi:MAG: response regulator [Anaerolineales bacterium]|nr:response regulator [Anaerolineales bacterium]